MIIRLRGDRAEAGRRLIWMKALNSVSTSLTPSRPPAAGASDQGTPMAQARGVKAAPRIRSMLIGAPATGGKSPRT